MNSSMSEPSFGKWRSYLWPVYRHESKSLLAMLVMAFLISFNYNILRTAKDALVVTAKGSGAETIPFIKVYVLLPMAIFMTLLFSYLSQRLSKDKVFYSITSIFLTFFAVFIFILYPHRDFLHPHFFADSIQDFVPKGFAGLIAVFRNWTFTCYYVMAELWGNIVLSLLFWGLANEITSFHQAKRFYGLIGLSLNVAGILSGQISVYVCTHHLFQDFFRTHDKWEQTLIILISMVILSGFAIMYLYKKIVDYTPHYDISKPSPKKAKVKMSFGQMYRYLLNSRYLLYIAIIVISYNLIINLVEVLWKNELKMLYPNPNDYNAHMSQVSIAMGLIATFMSLFISSNSLKRFGWTFTAMITPIVLLVFSLAFFMLLLAKNNHMSDMHLLLGHSPLYLVCMLGSVHNSFCRGSKYSVFDNTKEMAFIPLDKESKMRGKAAIDGVGSRLGKSGGSLIHQSLIMLLGTLSNSAPYVAAIALVTLLVWILAVRNLGSQVQLLLFQEQSRQGSDLEESA